MPRSPPDASDAASSSGGADSDFDASGPWGPAEFATATAIAPGLFFTCARLAGGYGKCWGYNEYGMLGNGTYSDSSTPVQVSNLAGAVTLAAAGYNACALLPAGTVDCWGDNFGAQLGTTTLTSSAVPVQVAGVSDAVQLSVGRDFDCALLSNRTAECWGANNYGQLGNGVLGGSSYFTAPASPVAGLRGAAAISAGDFAACALMVDGTVQCWGDNMSGQLGNGVMSSTSPVPVVVAGLSGATQVSAGASAACALLTNQTVWCWGDNKTGELGNAVALPGTASPVPVEVSGLTGVTAISAGSEYACAILSDRSVACWGDNELGTLGNGTTTSSSTPVPVTGLANVMGIAAGNTHACAALADGSFACWGDNELGELGDGTTTASLTPVAVKL